MCAFYSDISAYLFQGLSKHLYLKLNTIRKSFGKIKCFLFKLSDSMISSLLVFRPEGLSGNIWYHFLGCAIFLLLGYIVKEYGMLRIKC